LLRIVTDGAADMPEEWLQKYDIHILRQGVYFGNESNPEAFDFLKYDFYDTVKERREIPKTSFPASDVVKKFYRSILQAGDQILSVHLSSGLSGTFSAFQTAAKDMVENQAIHVMDSRAGSAALGFMCREARMLDLAGKNIKVIMERLEQISRNITIVFTLDTLEFARFSGRISALQSAIASLLRIKPIIMLHDGLLEMVEKVRTRQRSLQRVVEYVTDRVGDKLVNVGIVHAADPNTGEILFKLANQMLNVHEAILTELSIPVAAHLGPGAVGIVAYPINCE